MEMLPGGSETAARHELSPAVSLFHSLADPVRLSIVQRLSRGEARVVDLVTELELPQSTVSKHLACLRDCRLVDFRAQGRQSFYRLTQPALLELLASAEALLLATGDAVALCPVYGCDQ
jgi:ArsR family transcriptional regulator, cadmium/lead-responsive transcriptional repressor